MGSVHLTVIDAPQRGGVGAVKKVGVDFTDGAISRSVCPLEVDAAFVHLEFAALPSSEPRLRRQERARADHEAKNLRHRQRQRVEIS